MKTQAAIYIGFLASCAAFPVGLLRLWQHDPWPWCAIFGTLALVTIGLAAWSLVPRRPRTADQILAYLAQADGPRYALSMVNAGIGARGTIYVHLHRMEEAGLVFSCCEPVAELAAQDHLGRQQHPTLPRRLYSITDLGRQRLGIPSAHHGAGAGPHPVRRATLLAPLALLLPRGARAAALPTGPDLTALDLRAEELAWRVEFAIGGLTGLPGGQWYDVPPWHDVVRFSFRLRLALRRGASPEEVVAHAAKPEDWTRILSRLQPGADVVGAVRRAIKTAPQWLDDPAALRKWRRLREEGRDRSWARRAEDRQGRVAQVLAVLRGGAA